MNNEGTNKDNTTENEGKFTPRCSAIEKERRLRSIVQWVIEGQSSVDIIKNIKLTWDIDERQAKRYIKDAKDILIEQNRSELEEKRAFHHQIRLDQYRVLVQERKAVLKMTNISYGEKIKMLTSLSHQINQTVRDMAKIDGVFVVKVDHTSKGEKIGVGSGVFELSITTEGGALVDNDSEENEVANE